MKFAHEKRNEFGGTQLELYAEMVFLRVKLLNKICFQIFVLKILGLKSPCEILAMVIIWAHPHRNKVHLSEGQCVLRVTQCISTLNSYCVGHTKAHVLCI